MKCKMERAQGVNPCIKREQKVRVWNGLEIFSTTDAANLFSPKQTAAK